MNAEEMIDDVLDTVDDPSFDRERDALKALNQGMLAVAQVVLLPGLSDGVGVVTTLVDNERVSLPSDYLGPLLSAKTGGAPVTVRRNFADMFARFDGLSLDAGPVVACAAHADALIYQLVPAVPVDITLNYYRVPTPMTASPTSYPDGLGNLQNRLDLLSDILMDYAKSKLFSRIEDGMEGAKVNTNHHFQMFRTLREELRVTNKNISHPVPPITEVNY